MNLTELLTRALEIGASDIFVIPGLPLTMSAGGQKQRLDAPALMPADTCALVEEIYAMAGRAPEVMRTTTPHDDDFSFAKSGLGRFRVNVFRQRGSIGAVIRVIPFELPNPAKLNIPNVVLDLTRLTKGLVLITGPAGSGKSTTLACLIDRLNHTRSAHIVTMEDPIEFVHSHNTCIVTQREIPTDVPTYAEALRSAMRQAPDILLLGEMRDAATIETAMTAAEMAQLLFSTLHTTSAAASIERIVDAFEPAQQRRVLMQLSIVLEAVVSQRLVPAVGGGVVPAFEIMMATPAIKNLIREGKTHQIDSAIAAGASAGMQTLDQSLLELVRAGKITPDTALSTAIHPTTLSRKL
jgi:twitching motility protein PilT